MDHYTSQIYTSRVIVPAPYGRREFRISYGDKISVRVVVNGRTALEYMTDRVADMTDLTGDLRRRAGDIRGLAKVYIRNHDRGWTRERQLMLYGTRKYAPMRRVQAVQTPMFYPWEI